MATGGGQDGARPAVAVLFTAHSARSREGELLAKYVGLCMAAGGLCARVAVVGVAGASGEAGVKEGTSAARRSDGVVITPERLPTGIYKESDDLSVLEGCALWVLLLDAGETLQMAEKLNKRFKKKEGDKKRVVLSLQTPLRRLAQLSQAFPDDIVLHGGVGFQVVKDKDGVLQQLSQGCYFVERLAQEKVSALFAIDILESTGIQALSRRNVQALKWGTSMLRAFYYINALTGQSVYDGLRDRNIRLLYLQTLVEMSELLSLVMASNAARAAQQDGKKQSGSAHWAPDPIAATYLPLHSVIVLLPLPNWIFNTLIVRIFDFGLADSSFQGQDITTQDFAAGLKTSIEDEFCDMFELAEGRDVSLPTLRWLHTTVAGAVAKTAEHQKQEEGKSLTIRSDILRSQVRIARESTAASRTFFLKLSITVLLTVLLITFLTR